MARGMLKRYLSICLVAVMLLTTLLPVRVFAADEAGLDDANTNYEDPADTELEEPSFTLDEPEPEAEPESDDTADEPVLPEVSDYESFLSCFKVLEGYAQTYAAENGENANALIINYIRTGVERYTSGTWEMVCGKENIAFTAYVSEQDAANGTSASALKRIQNFTLPNGNPADLGHVFGAMDVANYAKVQGMTDAVVLARADMGSWAGDITWISLTRWIPRRLTWIPSPRIFAQDTSAWITARSTVWITPSPTRTSMATWMRSISQRR